MHVYRIEWPNGDGFYRSRHFNRDLMDFTNDAYAHPLPSEDTAWEDDYRRKWPMGAYDAAGCVLLFAFESLRSLRRWFYNDEWIRRMSAAGCLLKTYEVYPDTTVVGRAQVAFDRDTAVLVHSEPLINVMEKV